MKKTSHISVDATYKLIYQGFPVLLTGTTDIMKHFHPFGLAITSHETSEDFAFVFNSLKDVASKVLDGFIYCPKIVVADGAESITNGFSTAFSSFFERRVMCFAHVIDSKLWLDRMDGNASLYL